MTKSQITEHTRAVLPHAITRLRGTAEIELVLAMPLLIVLLFMALNVMYLHNARQRTLARSTAEAHRDAAEYNAMPDLTLITPLEMSKVSLRPRRELAGVRSTRTLPNSIYGARPTEKVPFRLGNNRPILDMATLHEKSALVGPAWTYVGSTIAPSPSLQNVRRWYTELSRYADAELERDLKLAGD